MQGTSCSILIGLYRADSGRRRELRYNRGWRLVWTKTLSTYQFPH